jgi:hypothetical protein
MQINNCLVIIKQTAMAQGGRAASFARKGDETAKRLLHADAEQKRTVDAVRRALKARKIAFEEGSLVKLNAALKRQLAAADFVISIGGDGTALGASHHVLGVILQIVALSIRWKRKIAVLCSPAGGKQYGNRYGEEVIRCPHCHNPNILWKNTLIWTRTPKGVTSILTAWWWS